MEQSKKRKGRATIIVLTILAVILCSIGILYGGVTPFVSAEYGESLPPAAVFAGENALYAGEYEELTQEKGIHLLRIRKRPGALPIPVLLKVSDTLSPAAEAAIDVLIPLGETRRPDQLLTNVHDNDTLRIYFDTAPDFATVGDHRATVILEDVSGNSTSVVCSYAIHGVKEGLSVEAGAALPDENEYLICDPSATGAKLISPYTSDMTHHVGTYPLVFTFSGADAQEETTFLTVRDTVPPTGEGTFAAAKPGEPVAVESLVVNATDETDLTYGYVTAPDLELCALQDVVVSITDEGGNETQISSRLYISSVGQIQVEARDTALNADDFGTGKDIDVEPFVPSETGEFTVNIEVDGHPEAAIVTVVDRTPPAIFVKTDTFNGLYVDHPVAVEDLFSVQDVSEATIRFANEPDWSRVGEQTISVLATDASGNTVQYETKLTLTADTEPPVLYGVTDRNAYVGEAIPYLFGVSATDDVDEEVRIDVDSQVDMRTPGSYDVVYTATDVCGNSTTKACVFTLIEPTVTEEDIRQIARAIMAEITTQDMVKAEKLRAIFDYVRHHIRYGNGINHNYTDWRKAAFDGFQNGRGDCYNIWAVTKALLDQTDITYISVERLKSSARMTRHYWVNVDLGTGWYVFDPTWTNLHKFNCFMWTEQQCRSCYKYWLFDTTKYPGLATETFDYDKIVQMERDGLLP